MENRFDLYDLPEGHEERFEAKLDAGLWRRRIRARIYLGTAVAAGLAVLLWIGTQARSHFRGAHTPESVYSAYLEQIGELYQLLADNATDNSEAIDWQAVLDELTEETVPLYDQLPEEMPEKEKTAVLKEYYGGLLDEAELIKEEMNRQKNASR